MKGSPIALELHDALTDLGFCYEQRDGEDRYSLPNNKWVNIHPDGRITVTDGKDKVFGEFKHAGEADLQVVIKA
jgi:hypothetical protein